MDPSGTHSDGVLIFGSQVVTFGTGSPCVADNINIKRPSKVLTRTNEVGVPSAEVLIDDVDNGDMQVQLPDANTAAPAKGTAFTLKAIGGTTANFKVSETSDKFEAAGETKIMVSFRKRFATGA